MKAVCKGLIVGCALFFYVFFAGSAVAASAWEVTDNQVAAFNSVAWCPTFQQNVSVIGQSRQDVCMFGGSPFQFGVSENPEGGFQLLVKHVLDFEFRPVSDVCRGAVKCLYAPERDTLIEWHAGGITVFKHSLQRLTMPIGGSDYGFDVTQPDGVYGGSIGAFGTSRNGLWLTVEVEGRGIDLINLDDGERHRIIIPGVLYGLGRDPVEELAVSNDGLYVAQMGQNAGFIVVEATPECVGPGGDTTLCMTVARATNFVEGFYFAGHPRFSEDSRRLEFYVASYGHGSRWIAMEALGRPHRHLTYLALGDSFSSGEGEIDDCLYKAGTNDLYEKCHQSIRAYPALLGMLMRIESADFQSIACAGARIPDIDGSAAGYVGQGARLGPKGLNVSEFQRTVMQSEALDTFLPGRTPQGLFVERYRPQIVTVGIGGNDAGFMSKLKTCAMPDLCEWAADPEYRYATGHEIQRLFDHLRGLYKQLHEQSPSSVLYAVGYPQIIQPEGVCGPVTATLLTLGERVFMRQGISYLNQVIRVAAESSGVRYLDVEHGLEGSQLCEVTPNSAVNGLRIGDDVVVLGQLPMLKLIGNETFHPTPVGHTLIAEKIEQDYGDLRTSEVCRSCAESNVAPPLPLYWTSEGSLPENVAFYSEQMADDHVSANSPLLAIAIPPNILAPNSLVKIELHSENHLVGEGLVDEDGSYSTNIRLEGLVKGFHTLHVFGTSAVGGSVDVYKIISYGDSTDMVASHADSIPQSSSTSDQSLSNQSEVLGATIAHISPTLAEEGVASRAGAKNEEVAWMFILAVALVSLGVGTLVIVIIYRRRYLNWSQDPGG